MGGQKLPFDIDPELDIYSYGEDGEKREDPIQALFPVLLTSVLPRPMH